MKLWMWCRKNFGLQTIRKRIFLLSKLCGGVIVLFYLLTSGLPVGQGAAFLIWFLLMLGVILLVDYLLGRFITRPVDELNEAAAHMAELDFSRPCGLKGTDEFGMLSHNLNTMADNLQKALSSWRRQTAVWKRRWIRKKEEWRSTRIWRIIFPMK